MKKEYLAKNIREGHTLESAKEFCKGKDYKGPASVLITTFDYGRDTCGNGTAHYEVDLQIGEAIPLTIVTSGKRREQVGYSGANEAALYALYKLGFKVDTSKKSSYDYQKSVNYPLLNWS